MQSDPATDVLIPRGSALGDFLYPAPAERNTGAIIRWWESRRLAYNLIIGATGSVSLGVVALVVALPPEGVLIPFPMLGILVYAAFANVCYSLGPATELALEKLWGDRLLPTGPTLFRTGLTFAVGLTLFPILIVTIGYVARILGALI